MKSVGHRRLPALAAGVIAAALLTAGAAAALAAEGDAQYHPSVGQEGKDVIWVPTPQALVERMLTMAKVKPTDILFDLGSGDGRTVITAAKKFGARATGVEFNPDMVALSRRNAEREGVADRAKFINGDIFATDFSQATVVTMYLLPSLNVKLRPTLLDMKPGTRVVSHAFTMDDWPADQTEQVEGRTAYLWIVPAKLGGRWRIDMTNSSRARYDIELKQKYQLIEGEARNGGKTLPVRDGRIRGDEVTFTIVDGTPRVFTGRLAGDRLEGVSKGSSEAKWTGTRMQ